MNPSIDSIQEVKISTNAYSAEYNLSERVRDGSEIHTVPGQDRQAIDARLVDRPPPGFHWYYWRIELADLIQ